MKKVFLLLKELVKIVGIILLFVFLAFFLPALLVVFGLSIVLEVLFSCINKAILSFFDGLRDGLQRYVK